MKPVETWLALTQDDKPNLIIDKHYAVNCPHCGVRSNITAISTPRWSQLVRYEPQKIIVGYRCDSCNAPIALRFSGFADFGNYRFTLSAEYEELERPMETFDYQYLPPTVASDFREALTCYSHNCLNAAAAMCRRTVQSTAEDLGAEGTSRVMSQVLEIKDTAAIDNDTFASLKQIILDGHDGAHPHLPPVTKPRAALLVELMKDVLYQLYVRKAKVQEAMKLRQEAIADKRKPE